LDECEFVLKPLGWFQIFSVHRCHIRRGGAICRSAQRILRFWWLSQVYSTPKHVL